MRDMTTIIRDRVQDMVNRGMTLAQVQAARPTMDATAVTCGAGVVHGAVRRGDVSRS